MRNLEQLRKNKSAFITSNDEIFDRIYYQLYSSRSFAARDFLLHCEVLSTICATYLLERCSEAYIINSANHSVCYADGDTWDLSLGLVFRDYKYPDLKIPEPEIIEAFKPFFTEYCFDLYYGQEGLLRSAKSIQYKVITHAC